MMTATATTPLTTTDNTTTMMTATATTPQTTTDNTTTMMTATATTPTMTTTDNTTTMMTATATTPQSTTNNTTTMMTATVTTPQTATNNTTTVMTATATTPQITTNNTTAMMTATATTPQTTTNNTTTMTVTATTPQTTTDNTTTMMTAAATTPQTTTDNTTTMMTATATTPTMTTTDNTTTMMTTTATAPTTTSATTMMAATTMATTNATTSGTTATPTTATTTVSTTTNPMFQDFLTDITKLMTLEYVIDASLVELNLTQETVTVLTNLYQNPNNSRRRRRTTTAIEIIPQNDVIVLASNTSARLDYILVCDGVVEPSFTAASRVAGVSDMTIVNALNTAGVNARSVTRSNVATRSLVGNNEEILTEFQYDGPTFPDLRATLESALTTIYLTTIQADVNLMGTVQINVTTASSTTSGTVRTVSARYTAWINVTDRTLSQISFRDGLLSVLFIGEVTNAEYATSLSSTFSNAATIVKARPVNSAPGLMFRDATGQRRLTSYGIRMNFTSQTALTNATLVASIIKNVYESVPGIPNVNIQIYDFTTTYLVYTLELASEGMISVGSFGAGTMWASRCALETRFNTEGSTLVDVAGIAVVDEDCGTGRFQYVDLLDTAAPNVGFGALQLATIDFSLNLSRAITNAGGPTATVCYITNSIVQTVISVQTRVGPGDAPITSFSLAGTSMLSPITNVRPPVFNPQCRACTCPVVTPPATTPCPTTPAPTTAPTSATTATTATTTSATMIPSPTVTTTTATTTMATTTTAVDTTTAPPPDCIAWWIFWVVVGCLIAVIIVLIVVIIVLCYCCRRRKPPVLDSTPVPDDTGVITTADGATKEEKETSKRGTQTDAPRVPRPITPPLPPSPPVKDEKPLTKVCPADEPPIEPTMLMAGENTGRVTTIEHTRLPPIRPPVMSERFGPLSTPELRHRADIERHRNKQRNRKRNSQPKHRLPPDVNPETQRAYDEAQSNIDEVLTPRQPSVFDLPPQRKRPHKRAGKLDLTQPPHDPELRQLMGPSSQPPGQYTLVTPQQRSDGELPSTETSNSAISPDDTRTRMAKLLEDAFSLVSPRSPSNSVAPEYPPLTHVNSVDSGVFPSPPHLDDYGSPNGIAMPQPHGRGTKAPKRRQFASPPTSQDDATSPSGDSPLFTRRQPPLVHDPESGNSAVWSPYRAFDELSRLESDSSSLPNSSSSPAPHRAGPDPRATSSVVDETGRVRMPSTSLPSDAEVQQQIRDELARLSGQSTLSGTSPRS